MTTPSDPFSFFLSTTFPNEYKTPAPPCRQALYSDVYRQKQSNPEGFQPSIGWWTNTLETVVKKGKQPQPRSRDHLVLHASYKLAEALRKSFGEQDYHRVTDAHEVRGIDTLPAELNVASFVVGRPLWWALSQLPFFGDDGSSLTSEQRRANYKGDYVVLSILKPAADAIIARRKSKPPGFTESLYTRQSFQAEFESVALKGATLSQLDVDVVLKYLERDARVVIVQKNKQLEKLLAKRLNAQETLTTVLNKIESAATEVEPLIHPPECSEQFDRTLLQQESVDATLERMADVLADHKEIEDAISLSDDLVVSSAGVPDVDDEELKDELEMLIEEQKKDEDEEKERLGLGEKRKAEEKERARVEFEKKRKAKEDGETLRQEEEEVRRKSEEVYVSPETDPRKDWEKWYDGAQAEKAAQAARDREAELRWEEKEMRRSSNFLAISCLHFDGFVREILNVWTARRV
ncbi:hypothetical protein FS837_002222 [Tulasnella sp. UAMH 9824]|nr:hypothetical protein FS837_002222 [Tulasnella sp. UAMH 9824]